MLVCLACFLHLLVHLQERVRGDITQNLAGGCRLNRRGPCDVLAEFEIVDGAGQVVNGRESFETGGLEFLVIVEGLLNDLQDVSGESFRAFGCRVA